MSPVSWFVLARLLALVVLISLGHAVPAWAIAPVTVGADKLFERGGRVIVPVTCHRSSCEDSSASAGGHRRAFDLDQSGRTYVQLPVSPSARAVRVTLRGRGWRRRLVLPIVRRPDPFRCGYGRAAEVLASTTAARVLRVSHDDLDGHNSTAYAYLAGRPYELAEEFESLGSSGEDVFGAAVVTARWAAVNATGFSRGDVYPSIQMRRRPDAVQRRVPLDPTNGSMLQRFVVTDVGAVATTQSDGCARRPTVRLVDASGERIIDDQPGVDPSSLTAHGETVSWLRDGQRHQTITNGPPPKQLPSYPYYQNCLPGSTSPSTITHNAR